jgi:hypothetical protein
VLLLLLRCLELVCGSSSSSCGSHILLRGRAGRPLQRPHTLLLLLHVLLLGLLLCHCAGVQGRVAGRAHG